MMNEPTELPAKQDVDAAASATQLSILLDAATSAIDEEFKRSERLDGKSRNQITVVAGLFTVVEAVVVALLGGPLAETPGHKASSFVLWLAVAGGLATLAVIVAILISYRSWKLYDDPTLKIKTIRDYLGPARKGNPAVGAKLVEAYATIADGRRENNKKRADALDCAAKASGFAILFVGIQLLLAFIAVAVR